MYTCTYYIRALHIHVSTCTCSKKVLYCLPVSLSLFSLSLSYIIISCFCSLEEHKRLHSLANSVCTLLRKCLPKLVLPVPSLNHPLSFSLPSKAVLASPTGRLPVKDKPTAPLQPSLSPSHLPLLTTSQPFLGTVSPTQSATSCPTFSTLPPSTFPSFSPQSMSHNLSKTQATDNCVSDWRECSVTQGGYTQDESAVRSTRGREMVVKLPQVTQDNVFGEGKPHAVEDERAQNSLLTGEDDMVTHGQNSAVWFIGVTPSGYRQKPVQSIDHEGDNEEELEDLSQFNAFFPELHVHVRLGAENMYMLYCYI